MAELKILKQKASSVKKGATKVDLLLDLLESGNADSLADFQTQLSEDTEAKNSLVEYLSLLRTFDKADYNFIRRKSLSATKNPPLFKELTCDFQIEPVPRSITLFRVRDEFRINYLKQWSERLGGERRENYEPFFRSLIKRLKTGKARSEVGLLDTLILFDPAAAAAKFAELYGKADKNFDLARCHEVLRTLESKTEIQTEELRKLCRENRQYLDARGLFASEYYQTVYYYTRSQFVEPFDKLLKINLFAEETKNPAAEKWIFHLYATGGMGKTMFARWLIARHLVPEPRRIPVARLDFDFLHLPTVQRFPWLLLLPIAEQLDGQIENRLFRDFLKKYGKFLSVLRPPESTQGDTTRAQKEAELETFTPEQIDSIFSLQFDTIDESSFQKPFVVVLDTLEEIVLHHKTALLGALRQLKKIHDYYPSMRLLLSGRYNLLERLPEFNDEFEAAVVAHELKLFAAEESAGYLTENRNIKDPKVVEAIIEKCESDKKNDAGKPGSNPFALALFADLYEQGDVKTPQDILSCPSVELAYLIRRVILRIKEPTVRWLLRYAVVPRNFTYDFFEKVVAPHLERQLSLDENQIQDEIPVDRPNKILESETGVPKKIWTRTEAVEPLDLPEIWNDLRKYASGHGFITFETGSENSPRLHPDVVVPMRLLLEDQEIFEPLHRDAAKYFEEKAKNPSDWESNIREAIYHRFHYQRSEAADFWRQQFDTRQAQKSPLVRLAIAEELTGGDFTDENGFSLLKSSSEPLIDEAILYEAHLRAVEAAISSIVIVDEFKLVELRVTIQKHLDYIRRLHEKGIRPPENYRMPFDKTAFHHLSARISDLQWNDAELILLLRDAIEIVSSEQMLLSLEIHLGDVLARNRREESLEHYQKALRLRDSITISQIYEYEIHSRIGFWYYNQNDFEQSLKIFSKALSLVPEGGNSDARRQILRYLADVYLKLGQYAKAIKFTEKSIRQGVEKVYFENALFISQVQARALYDPLTAIKNIEPYLNEPEAVDNAALAKFYGDTRGMLMQIDEALTQFETSKQLWSRALSFAGIERVRIARIKLHLLSVGNFYEAASLIDDWQRKTNEIDLDIVCQIRLLSVLLDYRNNERGAAREKWLAMKSDEKLNRSPRSQIRVPAAGLAFGFGGEELAAEFVGKLKMVETPAARLPLIDIFQFGETPFKASSEILREIENLLFVESANAEIIPHSIFRADAFRCFGEIKKAAEILDRAGKSALEAGNSYAYRQILLAKDRLGAKSQTNGNLLDSTFLTDFAEYPVLRAAGCLEQAARALKQDSIPECRELLLLAQEWLPRSGATTTELEAKLNELFGEAAQFEGNPDAAVTSFNLALAIYEKLGNKIAAARLREILPSVNQSIINNEKYFSVRLQSLNDSFRSELFYDGKLIEKYEERDEFHQIIEAIRAEPLDETNFYYLSKVFLGDFPFVSKRMGEILFSGVISESARQNSRLVDLRLDSFSPAAAKIPWEIVFSADSAPKSAIRYLYRSASNSAGDLEKIKWLQIAVKRLNSPDIFVDGIFGPETKQHLSDLKKRYNFPSNIRADELQVRLVKLLREERQSAAKVLIIMPRRELQRRSQPLQYQSTDDILRLYEMNNAKVKTLWANDIHELKATMADFQPDIIHLQSSFSLLPSTGQITLDFGSGDNYSTGSAYQSDHSSYQTGETAFSPVFFNDALTLLPKIRMRPLVILDAVCPTGQTQTIHQLFYRNIFAAELFQFGNAAGVIAMGLSETLQPQFEAAKTLVENLLMLESFGAAVNAAGKMVSADNFIGKICSEGIALFTNEPSLTVLEVEAKPAY